MYRFAIIHITFSLCYLIYTLIKKGKTEGINKFILVFFIPIFGVLYFVFINILSYFIKDSEDVLKSYSEYVKNKEKLDVIEDINLDKEVNIISVEEALIFNTNKEKRELLFDVLRGDYSQNISILKSALNNEDTETSHYAASALMRIKSKLDEEIHLKEIEYEKNKNNIEAIDEYLKAIKNYIESDLLDIFTYKKYVVIYLNILAKRLSIDDEYEEYYQEKINYELEFGNYQEARRYCEKYFEAYPNKEGSYLMFIKLYYKLKNFEKLYENIDMLKNSNIILSPKALNILRFWLTRRQNA